MQTIGIIAAMKEELDPLLHQFKQLELIKYAGFKFYKTEYNGLSLVIVQSKVGKVFASLVASILIERFKVQGILFTGVAGALSSNLQPGDTVLATKLCQHDFDISGFDSARKRGYIYSLGTHIETDKALLDIAKTVASKSNLNISTGTIATGDQFIADAKTKEFIRSELDAIAVEMEGGAVAQVCKVFNIPFLIIRTISDTADDTAHNDFRFNLIKSAESSANFLVNIVNELALLRT